MAFDNVVINTLMLLALAVPGFVLTKLKMLGSGAVKPLSNLLMYVCMPFMVLKSFLTLRYEPDLLVNILFALLFSVACTLLIMLVAMAVFCKKQLPGRQTYRLACMFSNCGFFGLPFLAAVFPDNGYVILYASMYIIVFNLLTWTLGIFMLTGDKKYISFKNAVLNPALIFAVMGFVPFIAGWTVPSYCINFANFWSTMTSPIAMTVTGIRLAQMHVKTLVSDWRAYVASAIRLLGAPAVMWCLAMICGITDANLINAMILAAAMPVAATTVVFAEAYTPDDAPAAVTTMLLSTVLCVLTIPLVCAVLIV